MHNERIKSEESSKTSKKYDKGEKKFHFKFITPTLLITSPV